VIILEGPDGGGKTTLAKAICEELGLDYRRPSEQLLSSESGPSSELPQWWVEQWRGSRGYKARGVYDRCFWISEPIYQMAQIKRDLLVPELNLWRGIHDLWGEGPLIVFCMPSMDVQYSNVIQDGRASLKGLEYKHLEKVNFMYWAFYAMWQNMAFEDVIHYDYTEQPIENVISWVDQALKARSK
jgi:hypothetical protein